MTPNGRLGGFWNDFSSNFKWFSKHEGCWDQVVYVSVACLPFPATPYDSNWNFHDVPINGGFHHVAKGTSSDPSDPVVYCDPSRNMSWTGPKTTSGASGKW
jgi:hypothetical protein